MYGNGWGPEIYFSPSGVGLNPSKVSSDEMWLIHPFERWRVLIFRSECGPVWWKTWWIEKKWKWKINKQQGLWRFLFFLIGWVDNHRNQMHFHFLLESMDQERLSLWRGGFQSVGNDGQFHRDALSGSPGQSLCRSLGIRSQTFWGGWDGWDSWDLWQLNWPWYDHDITIVNLSWVELSWVELSCFNIPLCKLSTCHIAFWHCPHFPTSSTKLTSETTGWSSTKARGPRGNATTCDLVGDNVSINFQIW